MEQLREFLIEQIHIELLWIMISGAKKKSGPSKIKIRPVMMKDDLLFQVSIQEETQIFHKNYNKDKLIDNILNWMKDFKQLQLEGKQISAVVLVSKKQKVTIKKKRVDRKEMIVDHSHNRKKSYILEEGKPVDFLVDLGVMTKEGKVVHKKYDKYRKINRFLEFIEDVLPHLPKDRKVNIIDFGCGKSYLTFAMYHYLKVLKGYEVRIIGLDLKIDVIEHCQRLAQQYGYQDLTFQVGDIADFTGVDEVDMVVSLHACDTATDHALEKAVTWGASVILSVPCCQHELNKQISCKEMEPILGYGLIKERMAALMTDAIRAQLLETRGYSTQILEFIHMDHTPKNILIRAVKTGKSSVKKEELDKCMEFLGVTPTLDELLNKKGI